jgi:hypothetical protein
MKQPEIKFSHEYFKMPICVKTRVTYLVGVTRLPYCKLPEPFITYDTMYASESELRELRYYPLPKEELILLTLFTDSEQSPKVWTTIRRYTPRKYDYYYGLIGKPIKVVLTSTTEQKAPDYN